MNDDFSDEPVYTISIAARLVRREKGDEPPLHPQTLRMYEREGLVRPQRVGKNRLYSDADVERLKRIQNLTQQMGVNLAGVSIILDLLERLDALQREVEAAHKENTDV
ncbi:MAG: MerR family transcriptional regulator [Armatimonadetes bacterium]|nr:MerR family transcriptional regulator [Armatimonadota bacterium]